MNHSSQYFVINVFNEGRFVMALDHGNRGDAIRESVEFQKDGFGTEIVPLSHSPIFESISDEYVEEQLRIAY